eukprot:jgi/Ulvmu1/2795/UM141_0002.1
MLNPQRVPRLEQVPHLTFPHTGWGTLSWTQCSPAPAPRQPISRTAAQPMLRNTQSTPVPAPPLEVDITALTDMVPPAAAAASPEAAIGPASAAPLLPRTTAMAREPMPATAVPLDRSQPSMSDPVGMVAAVGPVAEESPPAPPQVANASVQAQPPPSLAPYPIPWEGRPVTLLKVALLCCCYN